MVRISLESPLSPFGERVRVRGFVLPPPHPASPRKGEGFTSSTFQTDSEKGRVVIPSGEPALSAVEGTQSAVEESLTS